MYKKNEKKFTCHHIIYLNTNEIKLIGNRIGNVYIICLDLSLSTTKGNHYYGGIDKNKIFIVYQIHGGEYNIHAIHNLDI